MNDLEPYVCIFEDCKDAHRLFRDQPAWLLHMQTHMRNWTCTAAGHKVCIFETEQSFEDHMRSDHATGFKESQLPWYKKRSERPSAIVFTSCPLCGYEPPEERINSLMSINRSDHNLKYEHGKVISEDIAKHIALHLQALSVKALPWQENVEEEAQSETSVSKHANEGHKSDDDRSSILLVDDDISLEFVDDPERNQATISKVEDCEEVSSDENVERATYEEEWTFIPRPEYYGHDRDP